MFPSLPLEARLRMEARLRINQSLLRINPSLPMEARLRRIQKRKQKVSTLLTPFIDRIQNGVTHSILSYNSQIPMDLSLHLRMDPKSTNANRSKSTNGKGSNATNKNVSKATKATAFQSHGTLLPLDLYVSLLESITTILSIHSHFQSHFNSNYSSFQPIPPSI